MAGASTQQIQDGLTEARKTSISRKHDVYVWTTPPIPSAVVPGACTIKTNTDDQIEQHSNIANHYLYIPELRVILIYPYL